MAGYLVGAQGDTSAHDIAEKFAKEAAKPDALTRKREAAEKRKASDERRKSDEAEMLARARAEAEARREDMLKAREAAELADTQRREQEEKAEVAARQAAEAKVAEERRQAEALRRAQEDQRLAEQRAAEIKRQEEARLQAEAQRRAEEEKRLAEIRKAEEEARMAALRREEEVRVEATRQAEALRNAEEEHRLAEARRVAEEAMRRADEQQRIAERAREQEQMAKASEQALRSRLEAERDLEGERLADRLSQARAQREARVTTDSSAVTPPRDVIEQGPTVGAEAAGLVVDPRATRVTVLLLMLPGDRGIRRHNKSADPVLCGEGECYVSNGAGREANLLPARKALGFLRTWGQRAGACNNSLVCVFRSVDLARLDRLLMPVDMRVVRHDRREMREVAATSTCYLERGRLACSDTVQSDDYMMWIVPETLAAKAGPEALQRALTDGLPTGRTALAPSRTF
ncbi:MAG: hypothetical protein HC868_08935 [Sphingomonadales bacterium]|nr:hypothetical protein [Sphingomonadales bacterium]